MSVWYAKKIGSRLLDNVRKTKKHRHHKMVGSFSSLTFVVSELVMHLFQFSFLSVLCLFALACFERVAWPLIQCSNIIHPSVV